jgi:hypothetical protein
MNKFFHLKTHSIAPGGGIAGPGTAGRSTSVGGRSGVGSLGGGSQGPGGSPSGGRGSKSFQERIRDFILGEEGTTIGKTVGRFLGAISPVPFGSTVLGAAGAAIEKDIRAGGTGTEIATAQAQAAKGGRTQIEGLSGAERVRSDQSVSAAAPTTASKELERARKVAAGGRAGTLLAGRTIAEEKQRKSLLGQ